MLLLTITCHGRNILQPLCQPSTENLLSLEGSNGTCPYLLESYFYCTHSASHWLLCNYLGQFTPYTEPVTSSKEGSSCDIRHKGHIPQYQGYVFSLKWMPIHDRIKFCKATMVYKSVNDLTPNYMKDMFTYV